MGLGLDICVLAARPSHASLRLLRRSACVAGVAANHTARQIDADTEHKAPAAARGALASVYMPLAELFFFTKCYAKAAYPSPTDESGFDTPPSSSAATSS